MTPSHSGVDVLNVTGTCVVLGNTVVGVWSVTEYDLATCRRLAAARARIIKGSARDTVLGPVIMETA